MSGLEALSTRALLVPPVTVPTYWCTTGQMSLRNVDERSGHTKQFPLHAVRVVTRLVCPNCGNVMPLENGAFPDHWMGGSGFPRRCTGSRKRA